MIAPALTRFSYEPDPANPGWHRWELKDKTRFNGQVLGTALVQKRGERIGVMRIIPRDPLHTNAAGNIHGGVIMALADISLFSAGYLVSGIDPGGAVTVDFSMQFIGAGNLLQPVDSEVEMLRETRRLAFLRGLVVQGDAAIAAFSGTIRKPSAP